MRLPNPDSLSHFWDEMQSSRGGRKAILVLCLQVDESVLIVVEREYRVESVSGV
jgi:hypothetical protein